MMMTGSRTEEFDELLLGAQDDVASLARRLDALSRVQVGSGSPDPAGAARRLYRHRRRRSRYFDPRLFGEPAWDILLDLYIARTEARLVSTSSACIAASVPQTTALRCIMKLEDSGLVTRADAAGDERVRLVAISDGAFNHMTALLTHSQDASLDRRRDGAIWNA
jgi:DNA-binding MarR family transcriptional regulator